MEGRLRSFIDANDFYSAHQLILSHGQRLERAGKASESRTFLFKSIGVLSAAQAPTATLFDIIRKYLSVAADSSIRSPGRAHDEGEDSASLKLLEIVLAAGQDESHDDFWTQVAEFACETATANEVVSTLLKGPRPAQDEIIDFALRVCPDESSCFTLLADDLPMDKFIRMALVLLRLHCYGSASILVQAYHNRQGISVSPVPVQSELMLLEETRDEARAVNFVTLLVELLRREPALRDLFVQLQIRYADLLRPEVAKEAWVDLRESRWPPRSTTQQASNPLAAMLQSLMMNQ